MKVIIKIILKGLVVVVPIGATLFVIYWLGDTGERIFAPALQAALPGEGALRYRPGMGMVAGLVLVFAIGLLTYSVLFRWIFDLLRKLMEKIPVVKTVYGAVKDMMDMMAKPKDQTQKGRVVLVELPGNLPLVGLITQQDAAQIPAEIKQGDEDIIAVYLPMSYQIGGYTTFIPRSRTTPIDMTVEQAMRFALTAGLSRGKTDEADRADKAPPPAESQDES